MFNNWQNAVENKTDNMQMTEELEIEEVEPLHQTGLYLRRLLGLL